MAAEPSGLRSSMVWESLGRFAMGGSPRVRVAEHRVVDVLPSEGHAHEDRAVAIAPADRGRRLLVGHEAQERRGHGVAEGGQRGRVGEVASDDLERVLGQAGIRWGTWLTPSLTRRVWKCMPEPACPTAILGEKDTSIP